MATASYPARRQPCSVRLALANDGTLLVQCGTQDMGSGTYTALARAAAVGLGLPISRISVELGDTLLPEGPFSGGSQVTESFAPAVAQATADMRRQLIGLLASEPNGLLSNVTAEDVEFVDGTIRRRRGNAQCTIADVLRKHALHGLESRAYAPGMPAVPEIVGMAFGAVFAEVAVDPLSGVVQVRRLCGAYAAGRILNPALARSQYISGMVGGIGMALQEETVTDPRSDRIIGTNLGEYLIPVHADMPQFEIIMVEEHDAHLPEGVKGVGMLGHVGTPAAIANAIYQAIGTRVRRLPIRIEDILSI